VQPPAWRRGSRGCTPCEAIGRSVEEEKMGNAIKLLLNLHMNFFLIFNVTKDLTRSQ
jgi:hypothetical protein